MAELRVQDPEEDKITVVDFEFYFTNGKGDLLSVWPSKGDTVRYDADLGRWEFDFPRLEEIHTIERRNVNKMVRREAMRVFVDPNEAVRREMRRREEREHERKERRGARDY